MRRGDGHSRRGASSRRYNMGDDRMERALGEAMVAAEAEVDDPMNHATGEAAVAAEAVVDDRMMRTFGEVVVAAEAEVDDPMKTACAACSYGCCCGCCCGCGLRRVVGWRGWWARREARPPRALRRPCCGLSTRCLLALIFLTVKKHR